MRDYRIILYLMLLLLVRCDKKDPTNTNCKCCFSCEDIEFPAVPTIYYGRFQYKYPTFNPNNDNEFVYYYIDFQEGINSVLKYNLQTSENILLVDTMPLISRPKWGNNDRILLNNLGHTIFTIKSNGDSLKELYSVGSNLFPDWYDDEQFVLFVHSANAGNPYYLLRFNMQNSTVDTIREDYFTHIDVSGINQIAILKNEILAYTESIENIIWIIFPYKNSVNEGYEQITDLDWFSDNTIFISRVLEGIYSVNISTGTSTKILKSCKSRMYESLSVSSSGKKIVVQRVDGYIDNHNKLFNNSKIYLIDIENCDEEQVNL